jgi:Zn-dependent peptidase ImmA (M78 family)
VVVSEISEERFREVWERSSSARQVADELGRSVWWTYYRARRHGLVTKTYRLYTQEQREEAVRLYKEGVPTAEIEKLTRVKAKTVTSIANSWSVHRRGRSGGAGRDGK